MLSGSSIFEFEASSNSVTLEAGRPTSFSRKVSKESKVNKNKKMEPGFEVEKVLGKRLGENNQVNFQFRLEIKKCL